MPRFHAQSTFDENGVQTGVEEIPFTAEEETAMDQQEADAAANLPMKVWEREMETLENAVPSWGEDLFDGMSSTQQSKVSQETKDKIAAKKAHRSQRP